MIKSIPRLAMLPLLLSGLMLSACSDSTDSSASGASDDNASRLYVALTDAAGDFTQYTVDVEALTLYRTNGAEIHTLPNTTTLDFSQYVDVTEFLTVATVPAGNYRGAEITLNFNDAILTVENADGDSIPATAVDEAGDPLQQVTLVTEINGNEGFTIRPGQPASLTIDFDLEASNMVEIDPDGASATVTVNPVLVASTEFDDENERRVRGLLDSVDELEQTFVVDIRPFRIRDRSHGEITVHTDEQTSHEIDGVMYSNEDGLAALNRLDPFSPVVVLGVFNPTERLYLAREVYAGSSVAWSERDLVKGSVIKREGNRLSLIGAVIELSDGRFSFSDELLVDIDADTHVTKQGSHQLHSIDEISVGQKLTVLGDMQDGNLFDASGENGFARMRYSDIRGSVVTADPLEVKIQDYNRRSILRYDFSGTGVDAEHDADPQQYQVDTGTLDLTAVQPSAAIKLRGFPTPFGSAPDDFTAKTMIDVSQVRSRITVYYGPSGANDAVAMLDDSGRLLDLSSATGRHHLHQAGIITDLFDLDSMPLIQPAQERALFAIHRARSTRVFKDWTAFSTALSDALVSSQVIAVHSVGLYDAVTPAHTSHHLVVHISR